MRENGDPVLSIYRADTKNLTWSVVPGITLPSPLCDCAPVSHRVETFLLCGNCGPVDRRKRLTFWAFTPTNVDPITSMVTPAALSYRGYFDHSASVLSFSGTPIQQFAVYVVMLSTVGQPVGYYFDLYQSQWTNASTDFFYQPRAFGAVFTVLHRVFYAGGLVLGDTNEVTQVPSDHIDYADMVKTLHAATIMSLTRTYTVDQPFAIVCQAGTTIRLATCPRCVVAAIGTTDIYCGEETVTVTVKQAGLSYLCVSPGYCDAAGRYGPRLPCNSSSNTADFYNCSAQNCCWDAATKTCFAMVNSPNISATETLYFQNVNVAPVGVIAPPRDDDGIPIWVYFVAGAGVVVIVAVTVSCVRCFNTRVAAVVSFDRTGVTSKYDFIKRIGSGGFGTVFQVRRKADGCDFALKYIPCNSDDDRDAAMREYSILRAAQGHPNMICIIDMFLNWEEEVVMPSSIQTTTPTSTTDGANTTPKKKLSGNASRIAKDPPEANPLLALSSRYLCLVMTYCPEGDLAHHVFHEHQRGVKLSETWLLDVLCVQLCTVLNYLHGLSTPIVHRDLKPENVLLANKEHTMIVVTDFGLACEYEKAYMTTRTGSLQYVAPECWNRHYTPSIDMWAVGCILYAAATGRVSADTCRVMFNDARDRKFHKSIRDDLLLAGYTMRFVSIVVSLLQVEPARRANASKILSILQGGDASAPRSRPESDPESPMLASDRPSSARVPE